MSVADAERAGPLVASHRSLRPHAHRARLAARPGDRLQRRSVRQVRRPQALVTSASCFAPSLDVGRVAVIRLTTMRSYTAVVERCPDTRLYVGYVPGFPGAHSQGDTLEELNENLKEVIAMLLDDGEPVLDGEYVGTQVVVVA